MFQNFIDKIRRGFSRSAKQYDLYSGLHREIADKLFAKIANGPKPVALLDVGCGTGYLTIKTKEHFPKSQIIGLDFSQDMLKIARSKHDGIDWVLADGKHLPFSDGKFDILISNLAYQWTGDLPRAFTEAGRVMSSNGSMICSLFGSNTCQELFQSLDEAKKGTLQFTRLPNEAQVREALSFKIFKNSHVYRELFKIKFNDMYELIAWLKSIGANNLPREGYVGKEAMARAAEIYRRRFAYHNGIEATFEVIWVYVKR